MLDTERPALAHWLRAAEQFGWKIDEETIFQTIGVNAATTQAVFAAAYGADFPFEAIRAEVSRRIREDAERKGIALRPGLLVLLDRLDSLRIPYAVATSTARKEALWSLEKAGIAGRFTVHVCGDEVERGKPAPDIFLRALERLGCAPEDGVGFEDSDAGLRSLHAAGIRSIFVKDLLEPPPETLAGIWKRCADLAGAARLFD